MATFMETRLETDLVVRADATEAGPVSTRVIARARSYAADGTRVRAAEMDITDLLGAARVQGAADLLADVTARVKAAWGIA